MATECPRCGKQNTQERDFCECGEYLNWDPTGEHALSAGIGASTPTTTAPPAPALTPAPLPPTEALPAPVLLVLGHPGAPPGDGVPSLRLAAREPGVLEGVIRNQTEEVDSYALRLDGIPADAIRPGSKA